MPCGINGSEINLHDVNGCAGATIVTPDAWVDEVVPATLAYNEESRGVVTCLTPLKSHTDLAPIRDEVEPPGGKRRC